MGEANEEERKKQVARQYRQERRRRFIAEGMYPLCGKYQPAPGRANCQKCQNRNNKSRKKLKRANSCVVCLSRDRIPGESQCLQCKTRAAIRRQQLVANGKCPKCGQPTDATTKNCRICLDKIRKKHREKRELVFAQYGNACACCGETTYEFLHVDHVENNGSSHRRKIGQTQIINWLIAQNFPPGFQVLCANCNLAKAFYGVCPHQLSKDAHDAQFNPN